MVDGMEQKVHAGDVITMEVGYRHTGIATSELKLIEVQLGTEISEDDKETFEFENLYDTQKQMVCPFRVVGRDDAVSFPSEWAGYL